MIDSIYTNFFSKTKTNRTVFEEGVHVRTNDAIYRMELPHFFDTTFSEDPFADVNKSIAHYVDMRIRNLVDERLGSKVTMTMGDITFNEYFTDDIIGHLIEVEVDVDVTDNPYRKSTMDITVAYGEGFYQNEYPCIDFLRAAVAKIVVDMLRDDDFYDDLSDRITDQLFEYVVWDHDEDDYDYA